MALHIRGTVLPDGEVRDLYVHNGLFVAEPPDEKAETALDGGWLVPGLVDCHAHLSLASPAGDAAPPAERVRASAGAHLDAGVLLVREPGSPDRESAAVAPTERAPAIVTAGRFLAAPGRYFPGLAREVEPSDLPRAVAEEAGGGWVKVIGDFFAPGGPIEPSWRAGDLRAAADAAHTAGARIAIHATHPDTIADAVQAGFDSIEHGTGMTPDLVDALRERGTAWVPTLVIGDGVRQLAGGLDPAGSAELLGWLDRLPATVRAADAAGVTVLAGTDAGLVPHGWVAREVGLLLAAGVPADRALAAASWTARAYLGRPLIAEGAPADLVAYADDPRTGPDVLTRPVLVLLAGRVIAKR